MPLLTGALVTNGTSAILGQHKTCPTRDDNERTRPVTTPFVWTSQTISPHFVPFDLAHGAYNALLTMTYYSCCPLFRFLPMDNFTIHGGSSRMQLCRVVYDGLESSSIRRDLALSAILATDDPREEKRFGCQVRHFDHDFWQQEYEHIVLQSNLARFSQNEEMRLALGKAGQRRLAEASSHDKLWGIGLSGCSYRASSLYTWRGCNLLGQALKHVRDMP